MTFFLHSHFFFYSKCQNIRQLLGDQTNAYVCHQISGLELICHHRVLYSDSLGRFSKADISFASLKNPNHWSVDCFKFIKRRILDCPEVR